MDQSVGNKRKSQKRFARPAERPGIRLSDDDYQILWYVYRHRLVESRVLYRLLSHRSEQVLSRRLKLLFRTGFLDRPLSQNAKSRLKPGTDPYVYALDREGARALNHKFGGSLAKQGWKYKNAKLSVTSIEHHLETSRFVGGLAVSAQSRPGVRLLYADELISPEAMAKRPAGLSNTVRADVRWFQPGWNVGTAPDAIVGIEVDGTKQILFIEIDRGTETIEPTERQLKSERFWRDTSFLRKMLIYSAVFRTKAHQAQLGLPVFRVLTITTQSGRVRVMQNSFGRYLENGQDRVTPGLFLFSDWMTLETASDWLEVPYENALGRPIRLLDRGRKPGGK